MLFLFFTWKEVGIYGIVREGGKWEVTTSIILKNRKLEAFYLNGLLVYSTTTGGSSGEDG